jgi:aldehyde:ferredoxin oxidoreductase
MSSQFTNGLIRVGETGLYEIGHKEFRMTSRLLNINLTDRSYWIEEIPRSILDQYLGGRGLGAYLLYQNLPKGTDPLAPENVLIFSCGPVQGTGAYYSSRCVVNTKSPLTGFYLFSLASGNLGNEIKKAGYAAILIRGRSNEPTYVVIQDGNIDFRPARQFWGLNTIDSQIQMVADAKSDRGSCACIGPAGERLMKMAVIATEGDKLRTFGRGGAGAVMGSKNLKGFVISGSQEVTIADPVAFQEAKKTIRDLVKNKPQFVDDRRRFGTGSDMMTLNELGVFPTRNWQTGVFNNIKGIALTEIEKIWPRKNLSCGPYCINPCSHMIELDRGPWKGTKVDGPEYETIYGFGSNAGVDQFDAIVAAERICDEYGIDTMSCGATVSFAMECYEKGLINSSDTDGIDLRFGNAEGMVEIVKMIAEGKGIGILLGEGVRRVAEKIPGSDGFAMHVKGLELGGYECRGLWGQALQYALSPRGGCHHSYGLIARIPAESKAGTEIAGKGALVKNGAIARALFDSAILCALNISVMGLDVFPMVINPVRGSNYTLDDLKKVGFRIITLERLFNLREGLCRKDDYLPRRLSEEPLPDGPSKGSVVPIDKLLDEGYHAMGWDQATGIPLRKTLEELGLAELPV